MLIKNANKIKDFALLAPSIVNEKDKNYGYFENKTISKKIKIIHLKLILLKVSQCFLIRKS